MYDDPETRYDEQLFLYSTPLALNALPLDPVDDDYLIVEIEQ